MLTRKMIPALISMATLMTLSGCASMQSSVTQSEASKVENAISCEVPATKSVDLAFNASRHTLSNFSCVSTFDQHFDQLLNIAEGDPSLHNKRLFSDFLNWSSDNGLISTQQAKERFSEYFSRTFVALPNRHNNCSSSCLLISKIERNMKAELRKKQRGMQAILGDAQAYGQAHTDYENTLLMLEATCYACEDNTSS